METAPPRAHNSGVSSRRLCARRFTLPRVHFTPTLARHLACPPADVQAGTARQALEAVFALNPKLRHYVYDDQGRLRRHVLVFVDGEQVRDRHRLNDPLRAESEIYVLQALSGG